ncbi:MAG: redoxin domain-containing protein [Saprospiraceae bacterium]|nr:redoxin domain-containing protein [Saprospiraceae bacterium]
MWVDRVYLRIGCIPLLWLVLSCGSSIQQGEFVPDPIITEPREIMSLKIGSPAPDFQLPGVDGRWYSLDDFKKEVLVVVFLSNYCPYAQVYEDRLLEFYQDYQNKDVDLVVISPNSPLAVPDDAQGYSDLDDSYEAMKIRAEEKDFPFPYLYDGDKQKVSAAYGPKEIPVAYIFDRQRTLQYRGRIDYSHVWKSANAEDLRLSVNAVLRGGSIIRRERDSPGCKIYWSWDQADTDTLNKLWQESPVAVQEIDMDSLKTLMVNFSRDLRVINFWATWCGPCKKEFPEFLKMRRIYHQRPVELISVSLDDLENHAEVLAFLQQMHAPGKNYLLTEKDKDRVRKEVYEDWDGSLPFTIMVEPFGELYKIWQGPFDALEVRKAIVDHRLLGRYLPY